MSSSGTQVPLAIAVGVICLVVGVGAGGLGMTYFGYTLEKPVPPPPQQQASGQTPPAMERPQGMGRFPGMGRPGMGRPGMGEEKSGKQQLTSLVASIDRLTGTPLTLNLTEADQKKLGEVLKGLDEKPELSDEECMERVGEILTLLKDERQTLEASGYTMPGKPARPKPAVPNPFKG